MTQRSGDAERVLAEARELHRAASRERERVRRLAGRFVARVKTSRRAANQQVAAERAAVEAERRQFAEEVERFHQTHFDFQISSSESEKRLRDAWTDLQAERCRAVEERAASETYIASQHEALAAREADIARKLDQIAKEKVRFDKLLADRHKELEGLDTRISTAHTLLQDLQAKRDAIAAELVPEAEPVSDEELFAAKPIALNRKSDQDLLAWAAKLDQREQQLDQREQQIRRDRAALKARRVAIDRAEEAGADQRLLLAEQFAKLAHAQERWRDAERRTVDELEDLAHVVRRRERELDERERRLIQIDGRRRAESYALWQTRLKLDGWRGALTAHEVWLQTERKRLELELGQQRACVSRREFAVTRLMVGWSEKLKSERDRLRDETERWAESRARLDHEIEACDQQRRAALEKLQHYAALSLALDETFRDTLDMNDSSAPARRFRALQKRWSNSFAQRLREIDERVEAARKERRVLAASQRELHRLSADVAERNAASLGRAAEADRSLLQSLPDPYVRLAPLPGNEELAALRAELERLAYVMVNTDWLPGAIPEELAPRTLPFQPEPRTRAA